MQMPRLVRTLRTAPVSVSRQDLHELAVAYGMEEFDRKGECPPTWIVASRGNLAWFETPWTDMQQEIMLTECMRRLMAELPAHAYAFISEAFIAKVPEEDINVSLVDLPATERDDVLLVTSFDRAGGFDLSRFLVTVRRPIGPNFLGPRVDEDYSIGEIAMWNLFMESPTAHQFLEL